MIKKFQEFVRINESFDAGYAEEHLSTVDGLPDCVPNNAREWHNLQNQMDRLDTLVKQAHSGTLPMKKINHICDQLVSRHRSEWEKSTSPFKGNGSPNYNEIAAHITQVILLSGDPYKKSIFEIAADLSREFDERSYGPGRSNNNKSLTMTCDILSVSGLNPHAIKERVAYLGRSILSTIRPEAKASGQPVNRWEQRLDAGR
jgi:hypothetical protein